MVLVGNSIRSRVILRENGFKSKGCTANVVLSPSMANILVERIEERVTEFKLRQPNCGFDTCITLSLSGNILTGNCKIFWST